MKSIIIISATVFACVHTTSFSPQRVMVDVTNDFGICVLQLVSSQTENVAFSPYGLVSVGLVLYEGANGPTAAELHNTLRLPWDRHVTRIGFRDLHRYLKSYFTNDGFLRGLVLSKPNVVLHWNYTRLLQFYGFDLKPVDTTTKVPTTVQTTSVDGNPTTIFTTPDDGVTTPILTQPPTTDKTTRITNQETKEPPKTVPTTTSAGAETDSTESDKVTKITTANPLPSNEVITEPMNQETDKTTQNVPTITPTTSVETTESMTEKSILPTTKPALTTEVTAEKEMTSTEKAQTTVVPLTEPMTTNTVTETSKVSTTRNVDTETSKAETTPNIFTETSKADKTTNRVTEISKTDTTPKMEGRGDEDEPPQFTLSSSTQNAETTSQSMPTSPPTSTSNSPELTFAPETTTTDSNVKETAATVKQSVTVAVSGVPETVPPTTPPMTTLTTTVQETTVPPTTIKETTSAETVSPTTIKETTSAETVSTTTIKETTAAETVSPTTIKETTAAETVPPTENVAASTGTSTVGSETSLTTEVTSLPTTASETEAAATETESSKKKRAVYSQGYVPEHREGISNWVPHYQDPRWNYHAPLENWFFSYSGGERVPIITYSAYLPFAYLENLATLALQLPLDDPRYYMLILLPEDRNGLEKLLYSLQWCPLGGILDQLKSTAVYATIPVFTVVKHVNLVPALAKLGILSVFDPSTADLSAMSSEKGIFVRTIEQVVTVSLRKYFANYQWFDAKPGEVEQHFIANHPFAYFVLDKETRVTLMTGTIVNPVAYNQ